MKYDIYDHKHIIAHAFAYAVLWIIFLVWIDYPVNYWTGVAVIGYSISLPVEYLLRAVNQGLFRKERNRAIRNGIVDADCQHDHDRAFGVTESSLEPLIAFTTIYSTLVLTNEIVQNLGMPALGDPPSYAALVVFSIFSLVFMALRHQYGNIVSRKGKPSLCDAERRKAPTESGG